MRTMKPKVILPVRMPLDLKRWIQAQAKREHKTPSMWCWLALDAYRKTFAVQEALEKQGLIRREVKRRAQ